MSTRQIPDSGLYTGRVEYEREATTGGEPENPEYEFYADDIASVSWDVGVSPDARHGLGTADPVSHENVNEEPTITVTYWLQQAVVDDSDDPKDACADAILRDADNRIHNTHHVRIEESREGSDPDDPDGADGARVYVIGLGCHPDVTLTEDTDRGLIEVELTYECEKVREYEIFQPNDEKLTVDMSNTDDAGVTVTLEDDEGEVEEVSMMVNDEETTKTDWSSLRAIHLDEDIEGDIIVKNEADEELARIRGGDYYHPSDGTLEGDQGVPAIDDGSLATAINEEYDSFAGATIERGGDVLSYDVSETVLSFENDYGREPRHDSTRTRINEGNRGALSEFDLIGWGASAEFGSEALGGVADDVEITTAKTEWNFQSAVVSEPGDVERDGEDATFIYDVTMEPSENAGISVSRA